MTTTTDKCPHGARWTTCPHKHPPRAPLHRGDVVTVTEENIRPWTGVVLTVKPTPTSGWWIEVQHGDGGVWTLPETRVHYRA